MQKTFLSLLLDVLTRVRWALWPPPLDAKTMWSTCLEWSQWLDIGPGGDLKADVWCPKQGCPWCRLWNQRVSWHPITLRDRWPLSLCTEWSWEMMSFWLGIERHLWTRAATLESVVLWKSRGNKKKQTMCVIIQLFRKTSSKFAVMCEVFFFGFFACCSRVKFFMFDFS